MNIGSGIPNVNNPIRIFIAIPASVNECTEVSPKIPVRVKKVEYKTNALVRMMNIKDALSELPVAL